MSYKSNEGVFAEKTKEADCSRGVYFLADDAVYDWTVVLLQSLRTVAPDISLYCIPFSDQVERLMRLETRYRFETVDCPTLEELDEVGREIFAGMLNPPPLRLAATLCKMFAFWGPLDRFLYSDSDIVMLEGFGEMFDMATNGDCDFKYAHKDIEQVYLAGDFRERMVRDYGTHSVNTGLWSSRVGLFTLPQVREFMLQAARHADQFMPTFEQPFINYCLDLKGVERKQFEIDGAECAWAGDSRPLQLEFNGRLRVRWTNGAFVPAIHWAGYRLNAEMPYFSVHEFFKVIPSDRASAVELQFEENKQEP